MKNKINAILFSLFLSLPLASLLLPSLLRAEIIQLKNGNAIETKILKETEEFVVVEAPGGRVKIPKSDIQTIWRGTKEQMMEVRGKDVFFAKGVELYKEGKFKEAAASFEQSLGAAGMSAIIYANLGSAYAAAGADPKAEENFLKALQSDPENYDTLLNIAHFYESKKIYAKAVDAFQKYLKKKPDDEASRSGLANSYYALGQFEKALEIYQSLKRANEIPFLNNQAAALIQLGRLEEAQRILKPLVAGRVVFVNPFLNFGESERLLGRYDSAERQYEAVLAKEPKNTDAMIALIRLYLEKKDFIGSEEILRKLTKIDPENKNAKYEWAQLYTERGELAKAAGQYVEILEKDSKNEALVNRLGLLYIKMNEPKKALEVYEELLKGDGRYAKVHANAGLAYALMNDADNALKEWNRALELDPKLEAALQNKKLLEDAIRGSKDAPVSAS